MRWVAANSDYSLTSLLGLGCSLLTLIAVIEWQMMSASNISATNNIVAGRNSMGSQDGLEQDEFKLGPLESSSEIIDRPLFVTGRRPIAGNPDNEGNPLIGAAATKLTVKLMGVFSQDEALVALIADSKGSYSRAIDGDFIDGWQIQEVLGDRVVLVLGDSKEEIKLHKPRPKKLRRPKRPVAKPGKPKTGARKKNPVPVRPSEGAPD